MKAQSVRAVYDCNIFVQALINPVGPAGKCVETALSVQLTLFVSEFILEEIRESHQKLPRKYGVTAQQTDALAAAIAKVAQSIANVPAVFSYARDPDDAHYVNLALAAQAKLIVSRDRDLLDLMNERSIDGAEFKRRFPTLQIADPVAFLAQLKAP